MSTTQPQTTRSPAGPTPVTERALGPDLARGVMLLFIALANSHYFLPGTGAGVLGGFPQGGGSADRALTWLIATFVDGRAFPLFGLLFGYGVARIAARAAGSEGAGVDRDRRRAVRRLLRRRGLVLIAIGFLDAMLFFVGDILAAYGVLLLVGVWGLHWKDRTLLIVAGIFFALTALPGDGSLATSADPPDASMLSPDLWTQFAERLPVHAVVALLGPVGFACPFLVGIWAGRRRILEQPERHRRLLLAVAIAGLTVAVAGAQPVALLLAGITDRPSAATLDAIGPLHDAAGTLGGFGYAALIALVSLQLAARSRPAGRVTRALAATGQRSMTCYLAQSVAWCLLFTPYLLGLADDLTVTTTALLATTVWLGTVLAADRMRALGIRGPFETLLRRATYGGVSRSRAGRR